MLTHATTWINLEDIMPSEISQSQKDKHCMIHLYEVLRGVKFRGRKQNGGCQGLEGAENRELLFKDVELQ